MTEPSTYDAAAPLVTPPPRPAGVAADEWRENLSEAARYGGEAADLSREQAAMDDAGEPGHRFREILVQTHDLEWVEKTLAGLTHKALWRNEDTGASISLVRFEKGAGIPSRHSHASNQFMFCLSGRYTYVPTGITLTAGSFYWNPKGSLHGPTRAEEETVLLEVYDGPHYPTQPDWYTSTDDAR
jgi:quercetin dioxygenase-like cupin family protein